MKNIEMSNINESLLVPEEQKENMEHRNYINVLDFANNPKRMESE